jgi:methylenetetrahydrofolate dehydrogenase (NADP+)/methenyltetrahydrofolate cyclohydrolase
MSARVLDGRPLAAAIKQEVTAAVAELTASGRRPGLAVVLAGADEAAAMYTRRLERLAAEVGIAFSRVELLPETDTPAALATIERLNQDPAISGVLVQLPLPPQIDAQAVTSALAPAKDVDGVHPLNAGRLFLGLPGLVPATPLAALELLKRYEIPLEGKRAVVVGRSNIAGKPMALLLLREHATVTVCHTRTVDLGSVTREAEVLVAAAGRPQLIRGDMVRPGVVVVDIGTNVVDGKLVGDVHYEEVAAVASAITPVPGGVGPLTNIILLRNVVQAAREHLAARQERGVSTRLMQPGTE